MTRIARVVVEGMPHHITQRGNRRQKTFFLDEDHAACIDLMAEWWRKYAVEIWADCLMPNHIHLIAVPEKKGKSQVGHWGCTSPIYPSYQFQGRVARSFVAGAVFFFL